MRQHSEESEEGVTCFGEMDQLTGVYDPWGLQEEIRLLKVAQFEHAERLSQHSARINKLEKRHEDSRIKSLWSSPSPFPAPLSTFSQQPSNPETTNANEYDEQENLVLSGLPLDEVDIPRRGASRANSVRFDDSATTNHWIQDSPSTSDYFGNRTSNCLGGYAMTERSSSHKSDNRSDGRHSSVRSFGGDAISFEGEHVAFRPPTRGSDILDSCLHRTPVPKVGPAPAIVRCWLDTTSSFRPLHYAVICTGSAKSTIEMSLVTHLSLQDRIIRTLGNEPTIELPVFLPDGIVQQQSRITGPSKIPRLTVKFLVSHTFQHGFKEEEECVIQIFLGSDVISAYACDVLFSQSKIFLHVDDGRKVFIPFIRPEAEDRFSDIFTAHTGHHRVTLEVSTVKENGNVNSGFGYNSENDEVGGLVDRSERSQLSVSSPQPIHGRQASVIRGVASMEPRDFATKESTQTLVSSGGSNGYLTTDVNNHPWSSTIRHRKESFGASNSTNRFLEFQDTPPNFDTNNKATETENVTRGRSLTNPFEYAAPTTNSRCSHSNAKGFWEGTRKTSVNYAAPLKEGSGAATATSTGSNSRGSSRGMKVLRTSKSFSSADKGNNQTNAPLSAGNESAHLSPMTTTMPTNHTSFASAKLVSNVSVGNRGGHMRTMSGGGGGSGSGSGGGGAGGGELTSKNSSSRTKSSNVVGGATAFHWMASPKTAVTTINSSGGE